MPRGNFFSPAEKSLRPVTPRLAAAHRLRGVIENMFEICSKLLGDLERKGKIKHNPKYMNVKKVRWFFTMPYRSIPGTLVDLHFNQLPVAV